MIQFAIAIGEKLRGNRIDRCPFPVVLSTGEPMESSTIRRKGGPALVIGVKQSPVSAILLKGQVGRLGSIISGKPREPRLATHAGARFGLTI